MELFKLGTHCFWHFIGVSSILYIILYFVCNTILKIISRFFRTINLYKNGWPPEYVNGDGDFKPEKEKS